MLHVRTFGGLSIQNGDKPATGAATQPRRLAVLAVIARSGERGITRERLLALLWPDSDDESGRRTLAQALYALRKDTGVDDLFVGVQELRLNPEVSQCDAIEFEAACRSGALEAAVALYEGPFLDGFRIPGTAEFDRWIEDERDGLEHTYGEALEKLARRAAEAGDREGSVRWWRKRAALDPLSARVAVNLMEALVVAGETNAALQHARIHEALMEQQLELPPDDAVVELAERIRSGELRPPPDLARSSAVPSPVPAAAAAAPAAVGGSGATGAAEPTGIPPDAGAAVGPVANGAPQASAPVEAGSASAAADGGRSTLQPDPGTAAGGVDGPAAAILGERTESAVSATDPAMRAVPAPPIATDPTASPSRPASSGRWLIAVAAALVLLLAGAGGAWWVTGRTGGLVRTGVLHLDELLLLADLSSPTGDTLLASVATEALRIDLSHSRTFGLLDATDVRAALTRMQRPTSRLDEEVARELALREGIRAIIGGDVVRAGPGYVLTARVASAETGRTLVSLRENARDSTEFLDALDRLSGALRSRVGDSFRDVRGTPRLADVTTPSLGALRAYTQAIRLISVDGDYAQAIVLLEEAVTLDPEFASAYRGLDVALGTTGGSPARRVEATRLAFENRHRATDRERHAMAAAYYRMIGETDRAITEYRAALALAPAGIARVSLLNNLGILYADRQEPEQAEEHYRLAIATDSTANFTPYMNLQRVLVVQGRFEEAKQTIDWMERRFPDAPTSSIARAALYGVRAEFAEAEAEARAFLEARGSSAAWRIGGARMLAHVVALQGRVAEAEALLEDAVATAERSSNVAAVYWATLDLAALDLLVRRQPDRAVQRVEAVLRRHPLEALPIGGRPYLPFALFYALAERPVVARQLIAAFEANEPPELRQGARRLDALVRGALALAEDRPGDAVPLLRSADEEGCTICALPLLGEAYERAGQPGEAIAAYEKYLTESWPDRVAPWFQGAWQARGDAFWRVHVLDRLATLHAARGDAGRAEQHRTAAGAFRVQADPELRGEF